MPAIKDTSVEKRHNHSPLDRYSYDKLVYDEAGEPDVERVNALYYIPPEGQGYRMVDDDDMPFWNYPFKMQLMDKYVENNKVDNRVNIFFLDALLIVAQGIAGGKNVCFFQKNSGG